MTRVAIDAGIAIRLAEDERSLPDSHSLVAPAVRKSQTLDALFCHEAGDHCFTVVNFPQPQSG